MSTMVTTAGRKRKIGSGVRNVLILLGSLIYLIPLYIAISNAFKSYWDVIKSPLALPTQPTMVPTRSYSPNG